MLWNSTEYSWSYRTQPFSNSNLNLNSKANKGLLEFLFKNYVSRWNRGINAYSRSLRVSNLNILFVICLSRHLRLSNLFRIWHPLEDFYFHLFLLLLPLVLLFSITPIWRKIVRKTRFTRESNSILFDLPVSTSLRLRDLLNNADLNGEGREWSNDICIVPGRTAVRISILSDRETGLVSRSPGLSPQPSLSISLIPLTIRRVDYQRLCAYSDPTLGRPCVPQRRRRWLLNWCFCFARVRLHQLEHSRRRK